MFQYELLQMDRTLCHLKMLRYFCLICLLFCVQWTFCYDEIYDTNKRYERRVKTRVNHQSEIERRKRFPEYEELFKNPVAEFDVASFIQNPDEKPVDDNELFGYENTERPKTSKYFNNYDSVMEVKTEEILKNYDKSQDYLNVGAYNEFESNLTPPSEKDTFNPRNLNLNPLSQDEISEKIVKTREDKAAKGLTENKNLKNTGKKCPFKKMKIPFFSHNKSDKQKPKKAKKRKLFCIDCPKKDDKKQLKTTLNVKEVSDNLVNEYKVNKRSYKERLCPACKKKFIDNENKRRNSKGLFHNSRQFFQDINDLGTGKFRKDLPPKTVINKNNSNNNKKTNESLDTEPQMQELQTVEI